ncbi:hypothetical protein BH10PSE17_BH10PSE17_32760 [soil metagenome]
MSGSARKPTGWRSDLWVAIVTVLTGLFLAWFTAQLSGSELVKRSTARGFLPLLTPSYVDAAKRNAISIFTIDGQDLDAFGVDWPMPLDFLARRTQAILTRHPRAVFIDLLLLSERSDDEIGALRRVLCTAPSGHVFIATLGDVRRYSRTERALFDGVAPGTGSIPPGPPCAIPVNARVSPDKLDQLQWQYPMTVAVTEGGVPGESSEHRGSPDPLERSAALAIYCTLEAQRCPHEHERPMALVWPATADATNVQTMIRAVPTGGYEATCRSRSELWEHIPFSRLVMDTWVDLDGAPLRKSPICPYHEVVPLRAFNGVGFSVAEIDQAIANRIVMIGADITGANDRVNSPLNGSLPGVHAHAMALDNLIAFDGRYKEFAEFDWREPLSRGSLFVMISVVTITIALTLRRRYLPPLPPRKPGPPRKWTGRLGLLLASPAMVLRGLPAQRGGEWRARLQVGSLVFLVSAVLVMMLFTLGFHVFRQGPLAMVEYVLSPLAAHFLHLGEALAHRSVRWWKAIRSDDPWGAWYEGD